MRYTITSMNRSKKTRLVTLLVLVVAALVLQTQRQPLLDWWHLRGYDAPAAVAKIATEDTMTAKAKQLLYVNHPKITNGSDFTKNCPKGGEKTVVLGCYLGNDGGIYIYAVSDARLNGVEQVTAAHEMLHAAYRRLSTPERTKVDAELMDFYKHDLTDQRIKDTIAAYQKSEPNDVVNEMHSVFGTEVANLPAALTKYYAQYFTDRSVVTGFTASYQAEFTGRQAQIAAYDTQLSGLKAQIDANQDILDNQRSALDTQSARMDSERSSGQISAYNADVDTYNAAVNSYNALLGTTRAQINQYNDIVAKRNAIALEEQQLASELSSSSLPKQ
jgi:uncharacterized protein YdaU (DUF1376 family)